MSPIFSTPSSISLGAQPAAAAPLEDLQQDLVAVELVALDGDLAELPALALVDRDGEVEAALLALRRRGIRMLGHHFQLRLGNVDVLVAGAAVDVARPCRGPPAASPGCRCRCFISRVTRSVFLVFFIVQRRRIVADRPRCPRSAILPMRTRSPSSTVNTTRFSLAADVLERVLGLGEAVALLLVHLLDQSRRAAAARRDPGRRPRAPACAP